MNRNAALLLILACVLPATAADAPADPVLEQRVLKLSEELRCLVCQNQTIADSNAPLAVDLRQQVREQLASGMSEADVTSFMVQRYGDFVLYRPPVRSATLMLWFGPLLLLLIGLWLFLRTVAQRRSTSAQLSADEQKRLRALLDDGTAATTGNTRRP